VSAVELPSPVEAQVDAHVLGEIRKHGSRSAAHLERTLPKELAGESAFRAVAAALNRLRGAGKVRLQNNRYSLAPGVR
jgi:hypothetical protein